MALYTLLDPENEILTVKWTASISLEMERILFPPLNGIK